MKLNFKSLKSSSLQFLKGGGEAAWFSFADKFQYFIMTVYYENCYISCGCNRTPHSADQASQNGLICFAFCNSIAIYNPCFSGEHGKICHTLHGHKGRVNCVRWLKNVTGTSNLHLISGSADGTAIVWSWNENDKIFIPVSELKEHKNIITIVDGLVRTPSSNLDNSSTDSLNLLMATSSIDSTVKIWEQVCKYEPKCIDTINWNSGFCLEVKFSIFPNTNIALLACAADDNKVHLFAENVTSDIKENDSEPKFYKIHVLAGHEDWVRAIDFTCDENFNLYLATGSQDTYIRVYKFQRKLKHRTSPMKMTKNPNSKVLLETEEKIIKVGKPSNEYHYAVTLETILAGHEGWVYGVSWNHQKVISPHDKSESSTVPKIKLLSSSMDKSLIVWSPNKTGVWIEEARMGEIGGNLLGFYGGKFGPTEEHVFGHGYQGSFHLWFFNKVKRNWEPQVVVGGHTGEVMDLTWDLQGDYVLSVGSDQTTRLHAPWVDDDNTVTWHEIARPQIHGYDLNCIAMLSEFKYASGAEEKVIRAFNAPNNFVDNFKRITKVELEGSDIKAEGLPQGASVPALGLSNKPVFEQMKKEGFLVDDEYPDLYFSPIHLEKPPTEENLMQNTLWPEVQKLYGHGFEIYSLTARRDGVVLASSCKAASKEHAAIILWNAKTWLQYQKLVAHQLTVTQMSFSPNGQFLVSVSRDRQWCLFEVNEDGKTYKQLAACDPKTNIHTRVIWCCSWTFDSLVFATGSRDGTIGFWEVQKSPESTMSVQLLTHVEVLKQNVTAIAFAPVRIQDFHLLGVGLENGTIIFYKFKDSKAERLINVMIGKNDGHCLTVKRLAFRPKIGRAGFKDNNCKILQLASCGSDHSLKIYDLFFDNEALWS